MEQKDIGKEERNARLGGILRSERIRERLTNWRNTLLFWNPSHDVENGDEDDADDPFLGSWSCNMKEEKGCSIGEDMSTDECGTLLKQECIFMVYRHPPMALLFCNYQGERLLLLLTHWATMDAWARYVYARVTWKAAISIDQIPTYHSSTKSQKLTDQRQKSIKQREFFIGFHFRLK